MSLNRQRARPAFSNHALDTRQVVHHCAPRGRQWLLCYATVWTAAKNPPRRWCWKLRVSVIVMYLVRYCVCVCHEAMFFYRPAGSTVRTAPHKQSSDDVAVLTTMTSLTENLFFRNLNLTSQRGSVSNIALNEGQVSFAEFFVQLSLTALAAVLVHVDHSHLEE